MKSQSLRTALLTTTLIAGVQALPSAASAQDVVVVTGTRILSPNLVSSSPITTIGEVELEFQQEANIERIFRNLPITIPGDGQNVNNGTAGATTVNLRGLGEQRSLILVDGKRLTPYNYDGIVDVQTIPVNMIERVDIVTGGASAVYGSDAMAGAINFIFKDDFTGIQIDYDGSLTEEGDGEQHDIALLGGVSLDNGRGHALVSLGYTERKPVLLGDRPYGRVGVSSSNGSGLDGEIVPPPADCDGPNVVGVTGAGSATSIPSLLGLPNGDLQVRNDGSLGEMCSRFNFAPYNYYQTPQERYNFAAVTSYEINEHAEIYTRGMFTAVNVEQQVAASGVFGDVFEVPLMNPFLTDSARAAIIANVLDFSAETGEDVFSPTSGAIDLDGDGVFGLGDSIDLPILRRTVELGTRSELFDANLFQFTAGVRGEIFPTWNYDVSFQHGESDRTTVRAGYTNVTNIAEALNTVSADECVTPSGDSGSSLCVPLNLFGPAGSITPEMAAFASSTALMKQKVRQDVITATVSGEMAAFKSPMADVPVAFAVGTEYREEEEASLLPDACLQTPPTSCQGGAGGNLLPINGWYDVLELFGETYVPLVQSRPFFEDLNAEFGVRVSDYSISGETWTYKAGLNWTPVSGLRLRGMFQRAARAPNVGELFSPITTGLDNAQYDPCSIGNPDPISAELAALCVSTGVAPALVGRIADISAGQVNQFFGSDPANLPGPEKADTITLGFVYRPDFLPSSLIAPTFSVDYYTIEIDDYIDSLTGQEALDACYVLADPVSCSQIVRINGSLRTAGSGVPGFTRNLEYLKAEGIEVSASVGFDLGSMGGLDLSFNGNYYLTQESLSAPTSPVLDCKGYYGTSCDPLPEFRFVQRTTWGISDFEFSYLWRYISGIDALPAEAPGLFADFQSIDAQHYFDLTAAYNLSGSVRFMVSVDNVFNNLPPIIGDTTGSTSMNSGNTFPSIYDVFGRVYSAGFSLTF